MASRKARLTYWWTIKHYLNWAIQRKNIEKNRVLRGTGLRESELAGLDLSNMYLKELYPIYVPFSRPFVTVISKGNYDYSESGTDIVWLTRDAREMLEEWLEYRKSIENIIDKEAVL